MNARQAIRFIRRNSNLTIKSLLGHVLSEASWIEDMLEYWVCEDWQLQYPPSHEMLGEAFKAWVKLDSETLKVEIDLNAPKCIKTLFESVVGGDWFKYEVIETLYETLNEGHIPVGRGREAAIEHVLDNTSFQGYLANAYMTTDDYRKMSLWIGSSRRRFEDVATYHEVDRDASLSENVGMAMLAEADIVLREYVDLAEKVIRGLEWSGPIRCKSAGYSYEVFINGGEVVELRNVRHGVTDKEVELSETEEWELIRAIEEVYEENGGVSER